MKWLCSLIGLMVCSWATGAEERIVEFIAVVELAHSGQIEVTETIVVEAQGKQIQRGIYRDFPTRYQDANGRRVRVSLEVLGVWRNDQPEDWHSETISNGRRIYFGSADRRLQPGRHRYRWRYRTERQVGFFDQYDEIYWNATGHAWAFTIEQAKAVIVLPSPTPVEQLRLAAYTGRQGDRGQAFVVQPAATGRIDFETTAPLPPGEGLTVAVGFPKGLVQTPTPQQQRAHMVADHRISLLGLFGVLMTLAWYLFAWYRVGRDPPAGPVYPRYDPPEAYSPGMLRYLWKMGYDRYCLAAALVSLALQGVIGLEKKSGKYVVSRGSGQSDSPTEQTLVEHLLGKSRNRLELRQSNHSVVRAALKAHERALSLRMEGRYFARNRWWMIPGIALSIGTVGWMIADLGPGHREPGIFLVVFLSIWNAFTIPLLMAAWRSWRDLHGLVSLFGALFQSLFALPFAFASLVMLIALVVLIGWLPGLCLLGLALMNAAFWQWLRAPTVRGRELLDHIAGLQLYLRVAERQEIEQRHADAPPQTFEEFERGLPFAVALDAADTWVGRFAKEIEALASAEAAGSRPWLTGLVGTSGGFEGRSLGADLSAGLAAATAAAATAPGSRSGSSGGGSSGGGGGGGGGGGW